MLDDLGFMQSATSENQAREDAALLVRFELAQIKDEEETKKNGYPCYRPREMLRIRIPGTQEERVRRVTDAERHRFQRAYAAFKAGKTDIVDGTALKDCPALDVNEISMFNHHGVVSVEQVAALSDENISNMGHGVRPVRDRVKAWFDSRKSNKPVAELQARLKEKDEQLEALSARLVALEALANARQDEFLAAYDKRNPPGTPEARMSGEEFARSRTQKPAPKRIRNRKPKEEPTNAS